MSFEVNSFQVPNALVDELMAEMSGNELKCYLFIIRKTKGWHKLEDAISISKFMEFTKLSKKTVIGCCKSLENMGLIESREGGKDGKVYMCKNYTSVKTTLATGVKTTHEASVKTTHTKDTIKNNINNSSSGNANALQTSSKKYSFSDDDLKCASWIFNKIKSRYPQAKEPNFQAWANEIRLMRDRDKLTHKEICEVFKWANEDKFWSANILSVSKLRNKWLQLTAKMEAGNHESNGGVDWNSTGWLGEISGSACSF